MRILIVEDEPSLQAALAEGFEKLGYLVDAAGDGEAALELYYAQPYDAVILDMGLPKVDGLTVLQEIRRDNLDIGVLILSAHDAVDDRILGLDNGANDYIGKPFSFRELDARLRALLRRGFSRQPASILLGPVVLETGLRRVLVDDREVVLTPREYAILEFLALHRGQAVSSLALVEHIWGGDVDQCLPSLKVHIATLRRKLPELAIHTRRGQGYYVE